MTALRVSTAAAMKSGQCSLPEILGCLEMTKINAERLAFEHAKKESGLIQKAFTTPPAFPEGGNTSGDGK